jgi:hypothetical protein
MGVKLGPYLKGQHRLRVWEEGAEETLPKRVDVTGGWKRLHNEGLHNLYHKLILLKVKVNLSL